MQIRFVSSSPGVKSCPDSPLPEFAFIGRSNVGKSSLINMLAGVKGLAKVSATPGKTRLINHFLVDDSWYLVDLPGYGFARLSKTERERLTAMITGYISRRDQLACVFLLVDSRLKPQKSDRDFINWMGENAIPFVLVFTKTDKLSEQQLQHNIQIYKKELLETWEELPPVILTSARNRSGREEIVKLIRNVVSPR